MDDAPPDLVCRCSRFRWRVRLAKDDGFAGSAESAGVNGGNGSFRSLHGLAPRRHGTPHADDAAAPGHARRPAAGRRDRGRARPGDRTVSGFPRRLAGRLSDLPTRSPSEDVPLHQLGVRNGRGVSVRSDPPDLSPLRKRGRRLSPDRSDVHRAPEGNGSGARSTGSALDRPVACPRPDLPGGGLEAEMRGPHPRFGPRGSIDSEAGCSAAGGRWRPQLFGWMVHVYPFEKDPAEVWSLQRQMVD